MKTSTFFIISIFILAAVSCKNTSSPLPAPGVSYTVNPNTATTTPNYDFNDTTLTNHGWNKTFEDNFDGDLSKWNLLQGGVQGEQQCYTPANATIVNGALQISAKKETVTGPTEVNSTSTKTFNYTSAWLLSKSDISANATTPFVRIVARIKTVSEYGLTSVLCTFGSNWPVNGEIICEEGIGSNSKEYGTSYSYGTVANNNLVTNAYQFNPTDNDLSASYHVYTTEWSKNALKYYIDGNLVEVKTAGGHVPDLFGKTHIISLNVPIGGHYYSNLNTSNIANGVMYVDYIKVFTSKIY
jgi:beta-glucanase (GH16 family)